LKPLASLGLALDSFTSYGTSEGVFTQKQGEVGMEGNNDSKQNDSKKKLVANPPSFEAATNAFQEPPKGVRLTPLVRAAIKNYCKDKDRYEELCSRLAGGDVSGSGLVDKAVLAQAIINFEADEGRTGIQQLINSGRFNLMDVVHRIVPLMRERGYQITRNVIVGYLDQS
jgi:hypothetical protein